MRWPKQSRLLFDCDGGSTSALLNSTTNLKMGRFLSPDPSGLYYADITNPQSMNLYSYALNNPLINTDPTGMECVWDDGSYDSADDPDTGNAAGCSGQGGTYVDPSLFENATLTNGQRSSTNYGDWSASPNSTIAQSWTDPSSTTNGGSNADIPLSDTFSFNNLTQDQFVQQMTLAGIPISKWDTANNKLHNGTQLRSAKRYCGLHVTIDPGSGQSGKPVTGNFHLDLYDPVSLSNTNQLNYGFTALHAAFDVVPDKLQENGLPWFPTGNQQCPYQ
jgi:hypothetical protein